MQKTKCIDVIFTGTEMINNLKELSLVMAETMAKRAEEFAIEHHIKIAIAIMDAHGNLKLFKRMDGNHFISIRMSQLKAMTSASIPISTKALAERNTEYLNSPYSSVPGIVLLEGGLPIICHNGQHLGSIGISGATPALMVFAHKRHWMKSHTIYNDKQTIYVRSRGDVKILVGLTCYQFIIIIK